MTFQLRDSELPSLTRVERARRHSWSPSLNVKLGGALEAISAPNDKEVLKTGPGAVARSFAGCALASRSDFPDKEQHCLTKAADVLFSVSGVAPECFSHDLDSGLSESTDVERSSSSARSQVPGRSWSCSSLQSEMSSGSVRWQTSCARAADILMAASGQPGTEGDTDESSVVSSLSTCAGSHVLSSQRDAFSRDVEGPCDSGLWVRPSGSEFSCYSALDKGDPLRECHNVAAIVYAMEKERLRASRNLRELCEGWDDGRAIDDVLKCGSSCKQAEMTKTSEPRFLPDFPTDDQIHFLGRVEIREDGVLVESASVDEISPTACQHLQTRVAFLEAELDEKKEIISALEKTLSEVVQEWKTKLEQQTVQYDAGMEQQQHLVERLQSDKRALTIRCELYVEELKAVERKFQERIHDLQQLVVDELDEHKQQWFAAERSNREAWELEKVREIQEMTIRSLQPEVERIVKQRKQDMQELEDSHQRFYEHHQPELAQVQLCHIPEEHFAQEQSMDWKHGAYHLKAYGE